MKLKLNDRGAIIADDVDKAQISFHNSSNKDTEEYYDRAVRTFPKAL